MKSNGIPSANYLFSSHLMLFSISVPANNERSPEYMEQVLDGLFDQRLYRLKVELLIGRHHNEVMLYCRASPFIALRFQQQLQASYPDCQIEQLPENAFSTLQGMRHRKRFLCLQPKLGMLRLWEENREISQQTLADPLAGLLALFEEKAIDSLISISIRPCWYRTQKRWVSKDKHNVKLNRKLFSVRLSLKVVGNRNQKKLIKQKLFDIIATFGRFNGSASFRSTWLPRTSFLSTPELATLWHPATIQVRTSTLATVGSRRLEAPVETPLKRKEAGISVLGLTGKENSQEEFGMLPDDRMRHLAIIGKTGMGKSTLLLNLIATDIAAGRGLILIDPHGDLAEAVASTVPKQRTNDVIWFDAGDRQHPLAFNPLDCPNEEQRPLVASGILSSFKKLYGESWGPRLEYILRNALLMLVEQPGTSLGSLLQLLNDGAYRKQIVNRTRDPVVRAFWEQEFAKWQPKFQTEAVAPIQNKVGQFMSHPILRGILGQPKSKLDLRSVMDNEQILIVNLSKGRIGEDASNMLGSLLITSLQLAAMSRADIPESKRKPCYAYVDEFQNFATESFATILSEARKYGLSLTLANQYLDQIDENTLHALFGNVGNLLSFQVGARDADALAEQFAGILIPTDLLNLPKYNAYARLLIDGMPSRPFSMQTLPPQQHSNPDRLKIIRRTSQHRYGQQQE